MCAAALVEAADAETADGFETGREAAAPGEVVRAAAADPVAEVKKIADVMRSATLGEAAGAGVADVFIDSRQAAGAAQVVAAVAALAKIEVTHRMSPAG